jgi:hypothetical protein
VPVVANRRLERHPASRPLNPDAVVGVDLHCVAFAVAPAMPSFLYGPSAATALIRTGFPSAPFERLLGTN